MLRMDPTGRTGASPALPGATAPRSGADRVRQTAQEFEGVFLGYLMKAMRGSVPSGGLFREGADMQTYREFFDQEVGRSLARAGGIGLAQLILRDRTLREASEAVAEKKSSSLAGGEPIHPVNVPLATPDGGGGENPR
jgi:peptidoglycan hydrolase FlgJ